MLSGVGGRRRAQVELLLVLFMQLLFIRLPVQLGRLERVRMRFRVRFLAGVARVQVVERTVRGMLPKNRIGRQMARKLRVLAGPDHPHVAQSPEPTDLGLKRAEAEA